MRSSSWISEEILLKLQQFNKSKLISCKSNLLSKNASSACRARSGECPVFLITCWSARSDVTLGCVSAAPQGDFPWDEKDFRYLAVTVAGLSSALLYFYFRDNGKEISWKDFVHRYVGRGMVRSTRKLASAENQF